MVLLTSHGNPWEKHRGNDHGMNGWPWHIYFRGDVYHFFWEIFWPVKKGESLPTILNSWSFLKTQLKMRYGMVISSMHYTWLILGLFNSGYSFWYKLRASHSPWLSNKTWVPASKCSSSGFFTRTRRSPTKMEMPLGLSLAKTGYADYALDMLAALCFLW